jgi:hypothetical protein
MKEAPPLAIVIDMDPRWWNHQSNDLSLIDTIAFYVAGLGQCLPPMTGMKICVIASFAEKSEFIVSGDWKCIGQMKQRLLEKLSSQQIGPDCYESPIGQGISNALCFINRTKIPGRVVVFDCSREATDFCSQSVVITNCGWAAVGTDSGNPLAKINLVSLVSEAPSSSLISLSAKTGGVYIPSSFSATQGSLLQALFFHLVGEGNFKTRPMSSNVIMGTVCACHNKSIDRGYVCSICLSIYCSDTAGICSVCGSRMRREAKDDLPISGQVFEKLFASSQGLFS